MEKSKIIDQLIMNATTIKRMAYWLTLCAIIAMLSSKLWIKTSHKNADQIVKKTINSNFNLFLMETQLWVGIVQFMKEGENEQFKMINNLVTEKNKEDLIEKVYFWKRSIKKLNTNEKIALYGISGFLGEEELADNILKSISPCESENSTESSNCKFTLALLDLKKRDPTEVLSSDYENIFNLILELPAKSQWAVEIYFQDLAEKQNIPIPMSSSRKDQFMHKVERLILLGISMSIVVLLGLPLLGFFAWKILFGERAAAPSPDWHNKVRGMMEIFLIYMIATLLLIPKVIHEYFPKISGGIGALHIHVGISVIFFFSILFLLKYLKNQCGTVFLPERTFPMSAKRFFGDVMVGLGAYIAMIPVLAIGTIAWRLFLHYFVDLDHNSGVHPIVPMVANDKDGLLFLWIFITASICAPFIEELTFRGLFYSWLRASLPAWLCMLISSFIFAFVHPQGIVDIVPLFIVGFTLSMLREYRMSLISCIVLHMCQNTVALFLVKFVFN